MIGKVVTGCVAILPYHTATQDRGSECRDFGFISRIVTALTNTHYLPWIYYSNTNCTVGLCQNVGTHIEFYNIINVGMN